MTQKKIETDVEREEKLVNDITSSIEEIHEALNTIFDAHNDAVHKIETLSIILDSALSVMIKKGLFTKKELQAKVDKSLMALKKEHDTMMKQDEVKQKEEHYKKLMESDNFGNA